MPSLKSIAPPKASPAKWATLASLPIVLALLTGCASTLVATVEPFCGKLEDVCVSKDDRLTEGTASKIEGNNLALRAGCKRTTQCPAPGKAKAAAKQVAAAKVEP